MKKSRYTYELHNLLNGEVKITSDIDEVVEFRDSVRKGLIVHIESGDKALWENGVIKGSSRW